MADESIGYSEIKISRSGLPVPIFDNGIALHSLYDPEREARQIVDSIPSGSFVVFAGIGAGYHIREYLHRNPGCSCIAAESSIRSLETLASLVDISDILADSRVTVIPDCTDGTIRTILPEIYLPAIHGDFRLVPLRSWQGNHERELTSFADFIRTALAGISADFSVQSHFGKLWFRNFFLNLGLASTLKSEIKHEKGMSEKCAVIAAAGPGLEEEIPELQRNRNRYVIFSTDTAYGTLISSKIVPDFFVSIDAQSVSSRHIMHPFSPDTTVIMDLCGNPDIALRAKECGAPLFFAAGGHPLARYAASFSNLPLIDTSSGTVTLAALCAARACEFTKIMLPGADFAYVNGKPYARGTYLESMYISSSNRFCPAEHSYTALMFRSPVSRTVTDSGITYSTAVLDRYALACTAAKADTMEFRWFTGGYHPYPFDKFVDTYKKDLLSLYKDSCHGMADRSNPTFFTILPFVAWHRSYSLAQGHIPDCGQAIKLALDLIARYTELS